MIKSYMLIINSCHHFYVNKTIARQKNFHFVCSVKVVTLQVIMVLTLCFSMVLYTDVHLQHFHMGTKNMKFLLLLLSCITLVSYVITLLYKKINARFSVNVLSILRMHATCICSFNDLEMNLSTPKVCD